MPSIFYVLPAELLASLPEYRSRDAARQAGREMAGGSVGHIATVVQVDSTHRVVGGWSR